MKHIFPALKLLYGPSLPARGALWDGNALRLAPTFDHGAALARNLLDTEREERLTTTDQNRSVTVFAARIDPRSTRTRSRSKTLSTAYSTQWLA